MKAKRAPRLTPKERTALWQSQGGKCGCGCGAPLSYAEGIIEEHTATVALGNTNKADALYLRTCARLKTYGSPGRVGGDIRDIKHIRKLEEKRTQADRRAEFGPKLKSNRKLEGRGFEGWRNFKNEVVKRG